MNITIKRLDTSLPIPEYQTDGSAAFDLYSRVDMTCPAKEISRIPTNLIVETPEGYALLVNLRSSSPKRKGFIHPAGTGIVDSDYRGPEDEICVQVYNFTDQNVTVEKGERIGQAMFIAVPKVTLVEGELGTNASRGGFGSTGA